MLEMCSPQSSLQQARNSSRRLDIGAPTQFSNVRQRENPQKQPKPEVVKTYSFAFGGNIVSSMVNGEISFVIGKLNSKMILLLIIFSA